MSKLLIKILQFIFLAISATFFTYYLKLHADTNNDSYLLLSILFTIIMIYTAHLLFKDKSNPFILVSMFIKAIPIILLLLIDTLVFKQKITFFKILGVILIVGGIIIVEF